MQHARLACEVGSDGIDDELCTLDEGGAITTGVGCALGDYVAPV